MDGSSDSDTLYLQDGDEVICLVPFELDTEGLGLDEPSI